MIALGLSLGVWLLPAVGTAAPAEGGETAPAERDMHPRVPNFAIWVDPGMPEGERVGGWVEERAAEVLREHQPALGPEDLIRVAVRGGTYDYQIHIALLRNKQLLEEQPEVLVCECGSDEMLDRVGEAIGAGARRLTEVAAETEQAAVVKPKSTAPAGLPVDARKRLRAMGYVGVGVGVLGVGLLAAGIPLALRPENYLWEQGAFSRSTRPPGIGLAIGGSVAVATGITLIVVDVVRHRKRNVAIAPSVGARYAGLRITWKL